MQFKDSLKNKQKPSPMKIITTKSKVYKSESGDTIHEIHRALKVTVPRLFSFNIPLIPEKHFVEPSDESAIAIEYRAMMSLKAERDRQVSFSEMSANLPHLSTAEFDKFQNEVAQFQTRF